MRGRYKWINKIHQSKYSFSSSSGGILDQGCSSARDLKCSCINSIENSCMQDWSSFGSSNEEDKWVKNDHDIYMPKLVKCSRIPFIEHVLYSLGVFDAMFSIHLWCLM